MRLFRPFQLLLRRPYLSSACLGSTSSLLYSSFIHQQRKTMAAPSKPSSSNKNDHQFSNALIYEKSPYLLQHAHNPVNWYPWNDEALNKAKKENKLIFLSVGYSTCHWCHVMERESFENEQVAKVLNDKFVCIKVDREERPDIDKIYMNYVTAITQHGGLFKHRSG